MAANPHRQTSRPPCRHSRSVEEIAIVAAPGSSVFNHPDAIIQELLIHVQKPRAYRIAVLEAPPR